MRNRFVPILFAGVLLLAACAPEQSATPGAEPPTLQGTEWTVTQINGAETIADSQPTIAFEGGQATGTSGCNRFFGGYTQDGATLEFEAMGATQMYCAEIADQESNFFAALEEVTTVRSADPGVELTDSTGEALLTLVAKEPEADKPLEGTEWTLTSIIDADAVSSIVGDQPITLNIADGRLHASVCNQINGEVTVDGDSLKVGPLISTRMACPSEEESLQEGAVMSILEAATSFEIEGATLTIHADAKGLVFEAR